MIVWSFGLCCLSLSSTLSLQAEERPAMMSGWEAFGELTRGNARFAGGKPVNPRVDAKYFGESAQTTPHTVLLTCSDSRMSPERIFDQGFGDLFVVRTAGHYVDSAARASIEFGIVEQEIRLLAVLGSESCAATRKVFELKGKEDKESSVDMNALYQGLWRQAFDRAGFGEGMQLRALVHSTVNGAVRELIESSDVVKRAISEGRLLVAEAEFRAETGRVSFWKVGYPSILDYRLKWKQAPRTGFK
jgi:carbonic anhydrase